MKKILIFLLLVSTGFAQEPVNFGWSPPSQEEKALSKDNQYTQQLQELVKYNDDSEVLLYRLIYRALKDNNQLTQEELDSGRLNSINQGSIGECIGAGTARALDATMACDIYTRKENEIWKSLANVEGIYAIGRLDNLGRGDGSTGIWSVSGLNKYGTLHRLLYGESDLRSTKPIQGREWAERGLPKDLIEKAKEHKVIASALVRTPDEVKAALQNGYGIILCSDVGYNNTRDRLAFLKRQGSWNHCMACLGWRPASSGREGFLIAQSWGNDWANGPIYPSDCIYGGFWITPDDLKAHLRSEDCYAIAGFEGFKKRNLKWDEIFKIGEKINVEDN